MQLSIRTIMFIYLAFAAFFSTGCIDKTFKPATELEISAVDPYSLIPTATDTASLPSVSITVKSVSKIPCSMTGFTITYFTNLGEEIHSLAAIGIPIELKIDAEAEATVVIRPYTKALVDLYELSSSQISPVLAKITMNFKDINGNLLNREANCLLYEYDPPKTGS